SFCPWSWQDVHSGTALSAAYRASPVTPVNRPKRTEPSPRPKEEIARFIMRSGSHGGPSDKLPVHICGSDQKAKNHGNHGQNLAPFVDDIQLLSNGRLRRQCTVQDVQG